MARTRMTIRRVDPWSVLKFAFVANLVLLGVYLLVGAVAWAFVRRLELVETVCGLAQSVGYQECSVDGQALFDTMLVLGLLGVVIQTGVFVFLAFLANLIFDLIGGIAITLDDDRPVTGSSAAGARRGVGNIVGDVRRRVSSVGSAVSDRTSTLMATRGGTSGSTTSAGGGTSGGTSGGREATSGGPKRGDAAASTRRPPTDPSRTSGGSARGVGTTVGDVSRPSRDGTTERSADAPRSDAPRTDAPRTDAPRTGAPGAGRRAPAPPPPTAPTQGSRQRGRSSDDEVDDEPLFG